MKQMKLSIKLLFLSLLFAMFGFINNANAGCYVSMDCNAECDETIECHGETSCETSIEWGEVECDGEVADSCSCF